MTSLWNVILRKPLRNARGLFKVLLFLLSIKVFPFVWHVSCPGQSLRTNYVQYLMTNTDDKIRNFYSFFFRYLFNRRPIPRNVSLFEPTIWTSSRPLGELDIMGPQVQFNLLVGSWRCPKLPPMLPLPGQVKAGVNHYQSPEEERKQCKAILSRCRCSVLYLPKANLVDAGVWYRDPGVILGWEVDVFDFPLRQEGCLQA